MNEREFEELQAEYERTFWPPWLRVWSIGVVLSLFAAFILIMCAGT
jgi:hypothetical protein